MHPAAGAPGLVQVALHPLRRRDRDLLLLIRPGNPQVSGIGQVTAAGAGTLGMVILGPVRDLPRHGCPRAARLLPALLLLRPLSSAPLLPRRLPARQVVRARRHRGVPAVPRPRALRPLQLLPKAGDRRLQRGDLLRLRPSQFAHPVVSCRAETPKMAASRPISAVVNPRCRPSRRPSAAHTVEVVGQSISSPSSACVHPLRRRRALMFAPTTANCFAGISSARRRRPPIRYLPAR